MVVRFLLFTLFLCNLFKYLSTKPTLSNNSIPRIVGGYQCSPLDYPYLVSILTKKGSHYCGGSLVGKRLVLTAGHCCEYKGSFRVWTGLTRARSLAQNSYVSKKFLHPNYTKDPLSSDICLLQLSNIIYENAYTKYVKLVNESTWANWLENSDCEAAVAMGFGYQGMKYENGTPKNPNAPYNPIMHCVKLAVLTPDVCSLGFDQTMFCALDPLSEGHDPCQGDSGGPLICKNTQIGIISAGFGCGIQGYPSIYTRIDLFLGFIENVRMRSNAIDFHEVIYVLLSTLFLTIYVRCIL